MYPSLLFYESVLKGGQNNDLSHPPLATGERGERLPPYVAVLVVGYL